MSTRHQTTIEDLARVPEHGKAELVNGELRRMAPTGGLPGYAAGEIVASLRNYAQQTKSGYALGDNVGFVVDLPNRQSFSPDAAFFTGELKMEFLEGAPIFAAEVRSAGDYGKEAERELAAKRADYFAAGTLVVWDVDLKAGVVHVYRHDDPDVPTTFTRGESADAEPAVPNWRLEVDSLFPL